MGGSKKTTVGFRYFIGFHLGICHGAVDELLEIRYAKRSLWSGSVTNTTRLFIDEPELLGGEKREGGVQGYFNILLGDVAQAQNDYLIQQLGEDVSAYRGIVSVVAEQVYYAAGNPYLKDFFWRFRRTTSRKVLWYSEKVDIGGHMNPAHILVDCLTDPDWGLGLSLNDIDEASFTAAADTLHTENFGLSLVYREQSSIYAMMTEVVRHVEGALYISPSDGLYHFDLIRGGYDENTVPIIGTGGMKIISVQVVEGASLGGEVNEIVVNYTDDATGEAATTPPIQNLGSIQALGRVVSKKVSYAGVHDADLAISLGRRDLRSLSANLRKVELTVNREGWELVPGAVAKVYWEEDGINGALFRVITVEGGSITSPALQLTLAEDVFGTPVLPYTPTQPPLYVSPEPTPVDIPRWQVVEAPYYQLINSLTEADFNVFDPLSGFTTVPAVREDYAWQGFDLVSSSSSGSATYEDVAGEEGFCPGALVDGAYDQNAAVIGYVSDKDFDLIEIGDAGYFFNSATDFEMFEVTALDINAATLTVKRGILDTVPSALTAATELYVVDQYVAYDLSEVVDGQTTYYKLLTNTPGGVLAQASATFKGVTADARAYRPFPPADIRINGTGTSFDGSDVIGDFDVDFRIRNRETAIDSYSAYNDNLNAWEAGVTVDMHIYNDDTQSLLHSATGLTSSPTPLVTTLPGGGIYPIRIELSAHRDGYESMQKYDGVYRYSTKDVLAGGVAGSAAAFAKDSYQPYWRINISDTYSPDTFKVDIGEVELRLSPGGVDQATGGVVTASSAHSSYPPAQAFDDNTSSRWISLSNAPLPIWLQYELTSPAVVQEVSIRVVDANRGLKDFTIEYSPDGVSWVAALTVTGEPAWSANETRTYTIPVFEGLQ